MTSQGLMDISPTKCFADIILQTRWFANTAFHWHEVSQICRLADTAQIFLSVTLKLKALDRLAYGRAQVKYRYVPVNALLRGGR